jgi:hypothetical protein
LIWPLKLKFLIFKGAAGFKGIKRLFFQETQQINTIPILLRVKIIVVGRR